MFVPSFIILFLFLLVLLCLSVIVTFLLVLFSILPLLLTFPPVPFTRPCVVQAFVLLDHFTFKFTFFSLFLYKPNHPFTLYSQFLRSWLLCLFELKLSVTSSLTQCRTDNNHVHIMEESSSLSYLVLPLSAAKCNGVCSSSFLLLASAPFSTKT